ncbi:MAG: hypothetical protein WBA57_08515 [Elainellaceae cyanobacterium]
MTIKRFIIVQGPTQLLAAITVLEFQKEQENCSGCEDYLIVGYSCFQSDVINQKLTNACLDIAKAWDFKETVYLFEIEKKLTTKVIRFNEAIHELLRLTNFNEPDIIYVARNWQAVNELCLSAYPKAQKICYGDGIIGFVSVKPHHSKHTFNSDGLQSIDAAYLISPGIEYGERIFDSIHTQFIELQFLKSVIEKIARTIPGLEEYCKNISLNEKPLSIVLLANATESRTAKNLDAEIALYLSCLLRNSSYSEKILVKGHPRQSLNQSTLVCEKLSEYNFEVSEILEFQYFPVELFTPFIKFNKAVTLLSSSCMSLGYLCQCPVTIGFGDEFVHRYVSPFRQQICIDTQKIYAEITRKAYTSEVPPISFEEYQRLAETPQDSTYPITVTPDQKDCLRTQAEVNLDWAIYKVERDYLLQELEISEEERINLIQEVEKTRTLLKEKEYALENRKQDISSLLKKIKGAERVFSELGEEKQEEKHVMYQPSKRVKDQSKKILRIKNRKKELKVKLRQARDKIRLLEIDLARSRKGIDHKRSLKHFLYYFKRKLLLSKND